MQDTPRWHSKSLFQKSSLLAFFIFAFAIGLSVISPTVLYAGEVIGVQITPYTISRVGGAPKNSFSGKETVSVLSVFKKYITTTVLGIGPVKAQSSSLDDQGSGVSILDRFSLFLFCGIASIAGPLDKSNCDYDTVAKTIPAPPGSISNGNGEITNQQNSSPVISSLPVSPTAESSPRTQSSGITSPSPIITYINKYIPVPGPKGEDGRDGRDGKDAQPAAGQSNPPNSSNIPAGYGLYIAPSYPSSNLIGVSTIGYLLQTIIEKPSISDGLFTGTNVFSNSLVANMITASSTTLSSASITSLSAGSATTTDLYASQLIASSSTLASLVATNSTTTNAYIASLVSGSSTINNLFVSNSFSVQGVVSFATTTITDLTATRGVITNATTTNLFTQNLAVGNASTTGNQSIAGMFNVTGTSTLGANVYLNGSVTIGTSSNATLTINSLVNSNITPAANKIYDLGSPSFYWRDIYSDNINVNTLSAASTTISGTSNNTFSVNSDNGSTDGEDSSLVFFRGLVTPNALFRWNAATKRIETNQSFKIQNETPSVGTTTLTVQSGAGQGSTNLFELVNNAGAKLSAFSANGWLGIGSTTPGSALSVVGNAYVGGNVTATGTLNVSGGSTLATTTISQATITNASTTNLSAASLIATNATSTNFFTTLLNAVTAAFANLTTTGTTTLATNGGAVAINTTVPVAGNSLTVNGSAYVSSSVYGGGGVFTAPGYVVGLSGQNDFTSYIYSPTGTEIGFRANNGERMRIDANGNVGIGTTTPLARLTVQGSGSGFVNIGELSNASGYGAVNFSRGTLTASNYSLASDGGDLLINRQAGNSIHFRENNGTDQMFIAAGGNIGIGTTAPGQKLDVDGTIRSGVLETTVTSGNFLQQYVQGWSNTSYILNGGWSAGTGDYMRLGTGGNGTTTNYLEVNETAGVIVPTGNVGIGTASPDSYGGKLVVFRNDNGFNSGINIVGTGDSGAILGLQGNGTTTPNKYIRAYNGGLQVLNSAINTSIFDITDGGNVGIGTTTPPNKLTVQSATGVAQVGLAYDTTRFTSLQTDAIGNLNISTSNGNAVFGNDNLKVCQGGACPTAVATSTAGNLFVENAVIIGDGFSARQVSTTELGLYNASGTLMVIFDNGI